MGRKIWTQETLAVPDLQELTDQTVMRFVNSSARDVAIPIGQRVNGMISWLDSSLQLETVENGAWVPLRVGKSVTQVENGSYSFQVPQNATPQPVTGLDWTQAYNSGRQVDFEVDIPRLGMPAGVDCYVRLIYADATAGVLELLDGTHLGPFGAVSWAPLKLRGRLSAASGTPQRIMVQAWASAAGCSINAAPGSGSPLRVRWSVR